MAQTKQISHVKFPGIVHQVISHSENRTTMKLLICLAVLFAVVEAHRGHKSHRHPHRRSHKRFDLSGHPGSFGLGHPGDFSGSAHPFAHHSSIDAPYYGSHGSLSKHRRGRKHGGHLGFGGAHSLFDVNKRDHHKRHGFGSGHHGYGYGRGGFGGHGSHGFGGHGRGFGGHGSVGSCPLGYFYDRYNYKCQDVDECAADHQPCPHGKKCVNLDGGYKCEKDSSEEDECEKPTCESLSYVVDSHCEVTGSYQWSIAMTKGTKLDQNDCCLLCKSQHGCSHAEYVAATGHVDGYCNMYSKHDSPSTESGDATCMYIPH